MELILNSKRDMFHVIDSLGFTCCGIAVGAGMLSGKTKLYYDELPSQKMFPICKKCLQIGADTGSIKIFA